MSELPDDVLELQQLAFRYFLDHTNAKNGLVADNTREDSPCSIAATGLGLSCQPVAVSNGWLKRTDAAERVLTALRFFEQSPQGPEPDVTGYKGFYYHFLEMKDGRRAGKCELSTVDSAFLLAGMLAAGAFFDADAPAEREIRETADALYRRADWQWALYGVPCNANGWPTKTVEDVTIIHGGMPENGFISYRYQGYDESLLMHVLGLGSSTFALPPECYRSWQNTFAWREQYGIEYLHSGSAVHSPAQSLLARLPRNCRWVHASQGARLFREQSPCRARAAELCPGESAKIPWVWTALLGCERQ